MLTILLAVRTNQCEEGGYTLVGYQCEEKVNRCGVDMELSSVVGGHD
jgi:hypothetical protein